VITTVTYERLFNLGNYENLRLAATAVVEDDNVPAAFAEAKQAVEDQHAAYLAEKAETERRQREEWEARRVPPRVTAQADDDPIF
jgi:hypothetical protein